MTHHAPTSRRTLVSVLAAWLSGIASVTAQPAGTPASSPPPGGSIADAPKRFVFDAGWWQTGGLAWAFSRPAQTRAPDGAVIGPDAPRWSAPVSLASAPEPEMVRDTPNSTSILASGVDHDGVTPLLVVFQASQRWLDVFTVAGDALLLAEQTGVGRNRLWLGGADIPDLFQNADPHWCFLPKAGVVVHGLIVLQLEAWTDTWPTYEFWVSAATAFAVSQDQGRTWSLVFVDSIVEPGKWRGRAWSMQNWWPLVRGQDRPLEAFFAAADYRENPIATGGRIYVWRAARADASSPWTLDPVHRVYESVHPGGEHAHAAAVLPFGDAGLRVLASFGDGQDINRIVSLTRPDRGDLSAGWSVHERYHGSRDSPGLSANQFVGCAPSLDLRAIITGADLAGEQLALLRADDSPVSPPRTSFLHGWGFVDGTKSQNFVIRTPFPERGGPYVSTFDPHIDAAVSKVASRALVSFDGVQWAQAFQPLTGSAWSAAIHGGHVYVDAPGGMGLGLRRFALPTLLTRRPLAISPGGWQRAVPNPRVVGPGSGTISPLTRDPLGRWIDAGKVLDPQPPAAGQVYRVIASRLAESNLIRDLELAGTASNIGAHAPSGVMLVRLWILSNMPGKSAVPRFELRDSAGGVQVGVRASINPIDTWAPVTMWAPITVSPGARLRLRVRSAQTQPDDEDFYLAIDAATEGHHAPTYPLPQDATDPPVGTFFPDELSAVTGFSCGPKWTVTLALQLPPDGFDDSSGSAIQWPLATLWGDADNRVELLADASTDRLLVHVRRNGEFAGARHSLPIYWLRGSPILVSIAEPGDGTGIQVTLSAGGSAIHDADILVPGVLSPAVAPREIRMGDHTGLGGGGDVIRTPSLLWWGGQINERTFLNAQSRRTLLRTLRFLNRPGSRADRTGDGFLDSRDLLDLLDAVARADPSGDINQDGAVDAADVRDFLAELRAAGG